jgi:hypothetical protein
MKAHRGVLGRVVAQLQDTCPGGGILLAGSLMRGTEHGGSDIDLLAVVQSTRDFRPASWGVAFEKPGVQVLQTTVEGNAVCCSCVDRSVLQTMAQEPWRNYPFARAQVLADPTGVVRQCQGAILKWFGSRPDVERLWKKQERDYTRFKAALRRGRTGKLTYPTWDEFADHVDRLVRGGASGDAAE